MRRKIGLKFLVLWCVDLIMRSLSLILKLRLRKLGHPTGLNKSPFPLPLPERCAKKSWDIQDCSRLAKRPATITWLHERQSDCYRPDDTGYRNIGRVMGRVAGGGVCVTCKAIHLLLAKRMERITNNKQTIDKSDWPSLPGIFPKVNSMTRQALHYLGNFKVAFALPR